MRWMLPSDPFTARTPKREKLYVKHDNEWKKDSEEPNGKLKKAIKAVGHQNMGSLGGVEREASNA